MISIRLKLILTIGVLTSVMLIITFVYTSIRQFSDLKANMIEQTRINLQLVAEYSSVPLVFENTEDALEVLKKLKNIPHLTHAAIFDFDQHLFVSFGNDSLPSLPGPEAFTEDVLFRENLMYMSVPVAYKGEYYGDLVAQIDLSFRTRQKREQAAFLSVFLLLLVAASMVLAYFFGERVARPLQLLAGKMKTISENNDFNEPVEYALKDEIGVLIGGYNHMISQLSLWKNRQQDTEEKLRKANEILELKVEERTHDVNVAHGKVKKLLENEQSILRNLPYGILLVNEKLEIIEMNRFAMDLLGYNIRRPRLITELCLDIKDDEHILSRPLVMRKSESFMTRLSEFKTASGNLLPVLKSVVWIEYNGQNVLMEAFVDISDLKKTQQELILAKEKAQESDRLKSAFLATINHELRTPLNHILGFSELILSGTPDGPVRHYASIIQSSGRNLLSIIEDIFELSLIEQSNVILRKQAFSMMSFFIESKASFETILTESGKSEKIKLNLNPETDLLTCFLFSDRSKISQILTNLFKNAVKFTQQGTIEYGFRRQGTESLVFYVKDTGIGISAEIKPVIFDLFRQGDDSDTRMYGGLGIGLAISSRIAKVLQGDLTLESEPGYGSIFYLTIPLELSDPE